MHMGWRTYLMISFLSRRLTSKLFLNSPEAAETTFSALSPFRRTFKHFNILFVLFTVLDIYHRSLAFLATLGKL